MMASSPTRLAFVYGYRCSEKRLQQGPVLALRIVNAADIRAFVARDWRLIEELKKDQWLEQKAGMTPSAALEFAAGLFEYARALKPDWPNGSEREADLASHIRMAEILQRAA